MANKSRASKKRKVKPKARVKTAAAKPASRGKTKARKPTSVKMSKPPRQPGYIGGAAPMKAKPIQAKGTPAQLTLMSAAPTRRASSKPAAKPITKTKGKPAAPAKLAKPAKGTKPAKATKPAKPTPPGKAARASAQTSLPLPEATGVSPAHRSKVTDRVLQLYQETIDPDARLPSVLSVDPNDFDLDPGPFYEALEQLFKVEDTSKHAYAGYGGTIEQTIDFIAGRWNGSTPKQPDDVVDYE